MRISDWSSDVCSSDLRNPSGELPTLVDRDTVLHPASVVAQYLDERYPHPALMPADAASRARVRMVLTHFDRELFPAAAAIRAAPKSPDARRARKQLQERSEEHTSELQSLMRISYAVFCLKKKNKNTTMTSATNKQNEEKKQQT